MTDGLEPAIGPAMEEVPCYFCGASEGVVWGREAGYRALKCSICGLVYVSPRPILQRIEEATRAGEHMTHRDSLRVTGRYRRARVRGYRRIIKEMFADIVDQGAVRWLDIGAGFGELPQAVKLVFPAAQVIAVEPNEAKRREAHSRGVDLVGRTLDELSPRQDLDVVSLMNVWSHLPDPAEFLEKIRPLLTDGGRMLISTGTGAELPGADAYPDALLLPDHLSFAGERHVTGLLERTGFEVEAVDRKRVDTPVYAVARVAKRILGRPSRLVMPYRSPFRSLYVRARLVFPSR